MRSHSLKRSKKRAMISIAVLSISIIALIVIASNASAASGPKVVRGYILDSVGRTVEGADVTVNIINASTKEVVSTLSETTNATGFYSVTFGPSDWEIGDDIEVIATYNAAQESNSTTATDYPVQYVNVTYAFEIPEFGSMVGFLASAGIIGIVGWAAIKKKE